MTDQTDRPEVDDPRVLALAKARQQIAYESPFNFVCPPWDGLTEQEQHLSLLDARDYLRAALKAGLLAAPAAVPAPATDQAALRERIAAAVRAFPFDDFGMDDVSYALEADPDTQEWVPKLADTVLAVLPAPADRGAVRAEAFREAAVAVRRGAFADTFDRMADGTQQPGATPCDQPNACDAETGELCATHEEQQAHADGEHAFCGPTCEVEFPTELLRNSILAKGYPGTAGMLDELLRRATAGSLPVAELPKQARP